MPFLDYDDDDDYLYDYDDDDDKCDLVTMINTTVPALLPLNNHSV
jgi:hypothetical protein